MGTTKMNNDPKKGVVDEHCQVHGLDNLYVAGSGCYPTSGTSNPTLTLVALSLKLSEHLKLKLKNKEALTASS
jgi:choline dehydrogenase-like flavoprotein